MPPSRSRTKPCRSKATPRIGSMPHNGFRPFDNAACRRALSGFSLYADPRRPPESHDALMPIQSSYFRPACYRREALGGDRYEASLDVLTVEKRLMLCAGLLHASWHDPRTQRPAQAALQSWQGMGAVAGLSAAVALPLSCLSRLRQIWPVLFAGGRAARRLQAFLIGAYGRGDFTGRYSRWRWGMVPLFTATRANRFRFPLRQVPSATPVHRNCACHIRAFFSCARQASRSSPTASPLGRGRRWCGRCGLFGPGFLRYAIIRRLAWLHRLAYRTR